MEEAEAIATSQDMQMRLEQMRACTLCKDLPLGPKPVFQLDARAKLLIVGQAPGRIAHEKGRPFDDPSGERLRLWLGVDRATFYDDPRMGIFPMGLCFPGTGSGGDKPPPVGVRTNVARAGSGGVARGRTDPRVGGICDCMASAAP